MQSKRTLWAMMAFLGAVMWGISGLFAKALFNLSSQITPLWVSQVRMIVSGIVILLTATALHQHPMAIWHHKKDALSIIAYGLFGLLPVQYCYFVTVRLGNASIATILQFVGPFFVLAYSMLFRHQRPRRIELIAAVVAFLGVAIVATHGQFNKLAISGSVLFWGLLSAVGVATNNLIPQGMVKRFPSLVVTGWGDANCWSLPVIDSSSATQPAAHLFRLLGNGGCRDYWHPDSISDYEHGLAVYSGFHRQFDGCC